MGTVNLSHHINGTNLSARPPHSAGIVEQAERCLRCNSYLALKNVSCEYSEGVLTLHGCLATYYLKQMAQTAVCRLEGVVRIVNNIEVAPGGRRAQP